jgi:iron(III) transport system substrate-binding protein
MRTHLHIAVAALSALLLALAACEKKPAGPDAGEVVLYSSVDDILLRQIVDAFVDETGIEVRLVGDNEAVKTTGLVQRLVAERDRPGADVWWSSEPFGTIRLAEEGLLEPYESASAEASIEGGWPEEYRGDAWYGFALRSRVIAYAKGRVDAPPTSILEFVDPAWKGRVGMARPGFGTTRGHMGVLVTRWGEDGLAAWLEAMKANGLRLYDGNASVVRAIRLGEIDAGLADSDDVWAAQRNGWDVGMALEASGVGGGQLRSTGPILLPNTVALVRGGPNPDNARRLMDFILSERVEAMMARSDSRNIPVHPDLRAQFPDLLVAGAASIDFEAVADQVDEAMIICDEVLGEP